MSGMENQTKPYLNEESNLFGQNRILRVVVVAILLSNSVLAYSLYRVANNRTVVVHPVGMPGNYVLSGRRATDDYLRAMAEYVVHMVADVSAANAGRQYEAVLELFHPSKSQEWAARFQELEKTISRYSSVSYVFRRDVGQEIEQVGDHVLRVKGVKRRIVGDSVMKRIPVTYELEYKILDNQFYLFSVREISLEETDEEVADAS